VSGSIEIRPVPLVTMLPGPWVGVVTWRLLVDGGPPW
jgi:hypothetical protein